MVLSSNTAVLFIWRKLLVCRMGQVGDCDTQKIQKRSEAQKWCRRQGLWKAGNFLGNSEKPLPRKTLKVAGLGRMKFILGESTCPVKMLENLPSNILMFP